MTRDSQARLIERIGHPAWCPGDDLELLRRRDAGEDLTSIADAMKRNSEEVVQRWIVLRFIPGIRVRLAEVQPRSQPYSSVGGQS